MTNFFTNISKNSKKTYFLLNNNNDYYDKKFFELFNQMSQYQLKFINKIELLNSREQLLLLQEEIFKKTIDFI